MGWSASELGVGWWVAQRSRWGLFDRSSWQTVGISCVKMGLFARFFNFQPVMKAKLPALGYHRNREIPTY